MDRRELRDELQQGRLDDLRRRRSIIALSLLGMASMSVVSLYQSGILKQLPDLPLSTFDSEAVTGSPEAYWWGAAEGTWAVLGCALNLPLAALGGSNRASDRPLIPLLAAVKGVADAGIAAWYVYRMGVQQRRWCSYCLVAAGVDMSVFGLTLPEARKAIGALTSDRHQ